MNTMNAKGINIIERTIDSTHLKREIKVDFYQPSTVSDIASLPILLINDGQDMERMNFTAILEELYQKEIIKPILCVAIHAGKDRKMEYGIASQTDYLGRGAKAADYFSFVKEELFPLIRLYRKEEQLPVMAYAGFSLGGLTALDIVWNHPDLFSSAGVFSGSLWWRSVDQEDEKYDDDKHRIMHQVIRNGEYKPGLKFFFQCGNQDETHDRNNNGIIDSIDDTLDMMKELAAKGYASEDVFYMELKDGKHDVPTWGRAFPYFLKWIFGKK